MLEIQRLNIMCLPENYTFKYHYFHMVNWPYLLHVAEDLVTGKIVGYVMAKTDNEKESEINVAKGHITSLAVHRKYR